MVVVVVGVHTPMVTVEPLETDVPAAGVWLSTLPATALPLLHPLSRVNTGFRLAAVTSELAWLWVIPTTEGTEAQAPVETTRLTGVDGGSDAPAWGDCDATSPLATSRSTCWSGCPR